MSDIQLSKDTDKTLCIIYKEYLTRIKNNLSKSQSISFEELQLKSLFPNKDDNDLDDELEELKSNSIIKKFVDGEIELTPDGIVYMENRFKNNLIEITDFITKFIP